MTHMMRTLIHVRMKLFLIAIMSVKNCGLVFNDELMLVASKGVTNTIQHNDHYDVNTSNYKKHYLNDYSRNDYSDIQLLKNFCSQLSIDQILVNEIKKNFLMIVHDHEYAINTHSHLAILLLCIELTCKANNVHYITVDQLKNTFDLDESNLTYYIRNIIIKKYFFSLSGDRSIIDYVHEFSRNLQLSNDQIIAITQYINLNSQRLNSINSIHRTIACAIISLLNPSIYKCRICEKCEISQPALNRAIRLLSQ